VDVLPKTLAVIEKDLSRKAQQQYDIAFDPKQWPIVVS
jgi:hypothetical protein